MRSIGTVTKLFCAILATAGGVQAQTADVGQDMYQQFCATCHGADGKGAGPLTELLIEKVPDLTALAAANDGKFPMLDVIHVIDGRTGVRGHGGPMPVYGNVFSADGRSEADPYGSVLITRGRILSLATYLESIQQ
jgi:mono/diheme cytochrome c family protein